ncbi:MAG TPA: Mut7-C RNAse domain-containing protein [Nitrospirota bacterium]|nr:Mut7-C RNAse domain-containing protein [Nitrospirota bacterium]
MKFIADVMLGRLAKKLRLLGFDVLYDRSLDDNEIIRISLEHERMILTRDNGLAHRPLASRHLFIRSDIAQEQVNEVLSALPSCAGFPQPLTRCSLCNSTLIPLAKEISRDRVPDYVYHHEHDFLQCGSCGRVYWAGSHVRNMKLTGRAPGDGQ